MSRMDNLELARALTRQALALCDTAGASIAAGHLQLAMDRMEQQSRGNPPRRSAASWTYMEAFIKAPLP